jgi:omega-amidase
MNKTIRFCLVQANLVWENVDANLHHLDSFLSRASGADVIVLPEMFTTGFSMNPQNLADESYDKGINWMRQRAGEKGMAICGSMMCREQDKYYNRFVWMNPDGNFFHYDKKHLFRMGEENAHFMGGSTPIIIDYKGFRIRPMVCYDLRFPAWSRNRLVDDEPVYDVLLYVANWPERRIQHWTTLLEARAIENAAYVIGVNRVGEDGNGIVYNGQSMCVNYKGDAIILEENREQMEMFTLESEALHNYRQAFPVLKDADRIRFEVE